MELSLSTEEFELLSEILENELRRLGWEICRTDTSAYRLKLRARERLIQALADKARAAVPSKMMAAAAH